MKIWFTEIGEPLPIEENPRLYRYGNITRILASRGHDVTWWTSNFSHPRKEFLRPGDSEEFFEKVRLKILSGPGYKKNVSFGRIRHQRDFSEKFAKKALEEEVPDIIISPIPTLEVAEKAVEYGLKFNVPVVTDIRDEWPEELVDLAPQILRPFARLAFNRAFKRVSFICENVSGIMAMSQRQLDYGLKYANRPMGGNDLMLPHGYELKSYPEDGIKEALNYWKNLDVTGNELTLCFFGTIGRFFNLETVINATRELRNKFSIRVVLCGAGDTLEYFKEMANDVPEVIFPGWVDEVKIAALMRISKAGLAPYHLGTRMSLPNKPFEYMSGRLPIISSIQGELTGYLQEWNCGKTYNSSSVSDLVTLIEDLHNNPDVWKTMGLNGFELIKNKFSVANIAMEFENYLMERCKTKR